MSKVKMTPANRTMWLEMACIRLRDSFLDMGAWQILKLFERRKQHTTSEGRRASDTTGSATLKIIVLFFLLVFSGCASVPKTDHHGTHSVRPRDDNHGWFYKGHPIIFKPRFKNAKEV